MWISCMISKTDVPFIYGIFFFVLSEILVTLSQFLAALGYDKPV